MLAGPSSSVQPFRNLNFLQIYHQQNNNNTTINTTPLPTNQPPPKRNPSKTHTGEREKERNTKMDPPRKPIPTTTHLKPPPHHTPRPTSTTTPSSSIPPRAPVTAHPSSTIAESSIFQGTHPISIGAGTVIHPRTRIYSFHGPVIIEERCIIGEKSVLGTPPTNITSHSSSGTTGSGIGASEDSSGIPITLSANVTLGPGVTVHAGTRLQTGVLVEALATIHRRVTIGAHSKVCAGCDVSENTVLKEWMVVWGSAGTGQRRRVRAKGKMSSVTAAAQGIQALEAGVIEEARLMVLDKEREALARLIGASASSGRRR
ncbi:transferase hexapeptide domain protein [Aspergillus melleus]|uniref:transferase hexapeptide domain protein n=1 Tax=Aspergillus melleus TaxID=138277 RepID=UPI001E8D44BA|nr:uncharacterized protein LDX57_012938 [Aspergillus melleus]KAH8435307.1 hypothetical protein LDX57_012938 [Aspergillus melleus]